MSNGKYASFLQSVAAWWGRTGIGHEEVPQYTFICSTRIEGLLRSWLFPQGSVRQRLVVMMLLDVLAVTQRHVSTIPRPPLSQALPCTTKHPAPPLIFETSPLEPPLPPETSLPPHPETSSEQRPFQGPPVDPREGEEGTKSKVEGRLCLISQVTTAKQSVDRIIQKR